MRAYNNALVLSGGGARGAVQVGMLSVILKETSWKPDLIGGISVGALNGAMLATNQFDRLEELWVGGIQSSDIYNSRSKLVTGFANFFGLRDSIYDTTPLANLLERELFDKEYSTRFICGAVDLKSGKYIKWDSNVDSTALFHNAVLASAAIPVVFPPVRSKLGSVFVDGGVSVQSPLSDVAKFSPKNILVLHTRNSKVTEGRKLHKTLNIGLRSFDILMVEGLKKDIQRTKDINNILTQLAASGYTKSVLNESGRPYRQFNLIEVWPTIDSGDSLNFSRDHLRKVYKQGQEAAYRMLPALTEAFGL